MSNQLTPYEPAGQPYAVQGGPPGPRSGPVDGRPPTDIPAWQPYLYAILRYKWLVVLMLLLGIGAGFAATRFIAPVYTAETTLWVENAPDAQSGGWQANRGPIAGEELLRSYAWIDLLESNEVLEPVVLENRSWLGVASGNAILLEGMQATSDVEPGEYVLTVDNQGRYTIATLEDEEIIERGIVGDTIGTPVAASLGVNWTPTRDVLTPGTRVEFTLQSPRALARGLAGALNPELRSGGNFLRITLEHRNPRRAAEMLNQIVERFVAVAGDLKRAKLLELTGILENQLSVAADNLNSAETELEGFRVQTITLPGDRGAPVSAGLQETRDPVMSDYFEKRSNIEALRRDQDAIQRVLAAAGPAGPAPAALEVIPSVQESTELTTALQTAATKRSELRNLLLRYTPEHPSVIELEEDLTQLQQQTIPQLANALVSDLRAEEAQLESLVASASAELRQIPPRAIEEGRLTREVETAADIHNRLRQSYETARLAALSSIADVSVLDEATVPSRPSSNDGPRMFLVVSLGGLGLGLAAAILLGIIDSRVRFPHQVTDGLGLSILGALPRFHRRNGALGEEDLVQVLEALRSIRLNLSHAHGTAGPLLSVITSTGAGDGKSFVTSNLGLAFAELGKRTVIIDSDVRRGTLHNLTNVPRRPGLSDYLAGNATLTDVLHSTNHVGLDVITRGSSLPNAPELLASPAMQELLAELRRRYEVILFDSSPLGAAADALVLGTLTGNLVMVVRNDVTDKDLAEAQLRNVDRLPIRVLGAVLNGVPRSGAYRYYSYLPDYGTLVTEGAAAALARDGSSGATADANGRP